MVTEALGVMDEFLFDKLLSGWKPNQYIDEIKKLVCSGVDSKNNIAGEDN